jgi:DNA modification methylase
MMLDPYYDDGGCTIYHGDCREVLPALSFDAIVTDPPYGIAYDPSDQKFEALTGLPAVTGDDTPFDPSFLLAYNVPTVIWGGNCFASRLPDHPGWLAWDKAIRNGLKLRIAECEFAWTNCVTRSRIFRHLWSGAYRASEQDAFLHPTQKPVALMRWVIQLVTMPGQLVVDPFMGSGPTLRAAKDLGRRAIGIEIEEHYCEIAAKRLAQEVLVFDLPEPESGQDEVALPLTRPITPMRSTDDGDDR